MDMQFSNALFPDRDPVLATRSGLLFLKLCEAVPRAAVPDLLQRVEAHLAEIHAQYRQNEFLDIELADRVAEQVRRLLAAYADYGAEEQRLIIGAARYFAAANDEESDIHSIFGMEDDVRILNYVLAQIGEPEHRIEP